MQALRRIATNVQVAAVAEMTRLAVSGTGFRSPRRRAAVQACRHARPPPGRRVAAPDPHPGQAAPDWAPVRVRPSGPPPPVPPRPGHRFALYRPCSADPPALG